MTSNKMLFDSKLLRDNQILNLLNPDKTFHICEADINKAAWSDLAFQNCMF